uniref:Uncharacterized protein n=1 Tax=Arundo donax TaxID=35708 RepID=A0A0A8YJK5_ARUDO
MINSQTKKVVGPHSLELRKKTFVVCNCIATY